MMDTRQTTPIHLMVLGLAVGLIFATIAPTLSWMEFCSGSENLNIATALEIRRTGNWLIPTLHGHPRVAKPPLTAWITAAAIHSDTLQALSSRDPSARASAARDLAWQVRWPFLLMACFSLLAVAQMGRIAGGPLMGLLSALICGSTYAFLRFSRNATTDVTLATWVIVANAFIATAIFQHRKWLGCIGAGAALGLAFMCKGPVACIQTLLPAAIFLLIQAIADRAHLTTIRQRLRPWILPALLGAGVMLAIALPWFILVLCTWNPSNSPHPSASLPLLLRLLVRVVGKQDLWQFWYAEITRENAVDLESNPWYCHLSLLPMTLPWLLFLLGALLALLKTCQVHFPPPVPAVGWAYSPTAPAHRPQRGALGGEGSSPPMPTLACDCPSSTENPASPERGGPEEGVRMILPPAPGATGSLSASPLQPASSSLSSAPAKRSGAMPTLAWACSPAISHTDVLSANTCPRLLFMLALALIPALLMSFSRDRKERYLLPLFGPASVVAAYGVIVHLRSHVSPRPTDRLGALAQWTIVAVTAIAFPLIGATSATQAMDGRPWFSPTLACIAALFGSAILITGLILNRTRPLSIILATLAAALLAQALFAHGYSKAEGLSEARGLAELIWTKRPDAHVYCALDRRGPQDLAIYMNREIRDVADPRDIPADDPHAVLILLQRKKQPPPTTPAGWIWLGEHRHNRTTWHAYARGD